MRLARRYSTHGISASPAKRDDGEGPGSGVLSQKCRWRKRLSDSFAWRHVGKQTFMALARAGVFEEKVYTLLQKVILIKDPIEI